jgi:hypothetical protein
MIENQPNDPSNRRVSLIVLYQSREAAYDQIEVGEEIMADL